MTDMLRLAEIPPRRRAPMPHQVTFPVYCDEQWDRLQKLFRQKRVMPQRVRFNIRTGAEVSFKDDEDAVLIKLAFDST